MSSLAWIGSRGSATEPTPSISSSGASNSVVPGAKKSPGRRTLPNTAAMSSMTMDIKPAGEMLMREADGMAKGQPRPPWTPTYASIFPEGFEALGGELGVAHRVLNVLVPEIMLQGSRVLAVVGQLIAARVPQHVWVYRERKCCGLPRAGQHLAKAGWRHRRLSLGRKHIPGRHRFALELTQGPQFPAPERVDAGHAVLDPPDVQQPVLEVDLIPAERAQLGDTQAMAVSDLDHGGVAVPVPVLACGGDQALDFFGGQVFAWSALGLGHGPWRNCPILRDWRGGSGRGVAHRARALAHA